MPEATAGDCILLPVDEANPKEEEDVDLCLQADRLPGVVDCRRDNAEEAMEAGINNLTINHPGATEGMTYACGDRILLPIEEANPE